MEGTRGLRDERSAVGPAFGTQHGGHNYECTAARASIPWGDGRKGKGRGGKERGGKGRGRERKEEKGISGATSSGKEDRQRRVRQCHESECN